MDLEQHIADVAGDNPGVRIDCYVLFASHTDAMELYAFVRSAGFDARVSTTPRQARSSCGVALLVPSDQAVGLQRAVDEAGMAYERIVALPCQIDPRRDVYC